MFLGDDTTFLILGFQLDGWTTSRMRLLRHLQARRLMMDQQAKANSMASLLEPA